MEPENRLLTAPAQNGSLLRFDPDGARPMVSYVIAILEGLDHVPLGAIRIQHG